MPLLGVSHSVDLGDLFVDVNILEAINSDRRVEQDDLWQDFINGVKNYSSYRSFDRIGLGNQQQRVSGLEVLDKNTNLMVLGKPGSGKTTYLQRIVTECNQGNLQPHRVPVLIKLRDFVDDDDAREFEFNLKPYLTQHWELDKTETELILNHGKALILLDGLDEVAGKDGRDISKKIKQFARNYPQNQLIVTCRTNRIEDDFNWKSLRFDFIEVADFNEQQVNAFVEHYFNAVNPNKQEGQKKAKEFLENFYLEQNQNIRKLAITPILLNLTCAVFHQKGKFYPKRSKLYEEGLELLLKKWDDSKGIERDEIYKYLSPEREQELLSYLAVKKFEQPQYVLFEQEEIEGYIAEFLDITRRDSRVVLKAIEEQHGLLIERAQQVWSFSHLTFQEYFVAKWFCDYGDLQRLSKNVFESHYREVFLLATEIFSNPIQLIKLMKQEIDYKLGEDRYIQNFLSRVYEKSESVSSPYHPTKIRFFYFEINRNKILDFQENSNYSISQNFDLDINSLLNPEYPSDCILDYKLALLLYNAYYIAANPPYIREFDYFYSNQKFLKIYKMVISYPLDDNFRIDLENIKTLLPKFSWESSIKFRDWAVKEGHTWADKFRELIVKYRNIRHDLLLLPENHWRLLDQYYNVNKLLVECLNSNCHLYNAVNINNEIIDTLLLPIAEIEKRNHER